MRQPQLPLSMALLAVGLLAASTVHAQDVLQTEDGASRDTVAVTTSLTSLLTPVLTLKTEWPVVPLLTLAPYAAVGRYTTNRLDRLTLLGAGTQAILYPWRDFRRGLQLVADVDYTHSFATAEDITGDGNRVRGALLVGAKWTGTRGFVGEAQLGIGIRQQWGETRTSSQTQAFSDFTWEPRFNINVGYGF
jgi:hypothetical protein